MSFHERTSSAAKGRWKGILQHFGLPAAVLVNRHGPCPMCESKDNFRFDDKDGSGSWICTCGAGDGMKLAMEVTGRTFREVASEIDGMVGNVAVDATPREAMPEAKRMDALREVYLASKPMTEGDLAHRYLVSRRLDDRIYPAALRFAEKLRDGDGGIRPCMVAMIGVHGETDAKGRQKYCSMHRTFLRPDGSGKAEMQSPRKLMPGTLPDGACVMLTEWHGHGPIGIAEGIETALAASRRFQMPVWAAISSGMLAKWTPPEGAESVCVFGDNDRKFGGQAAAFTLAHKLAVKGLEVNVHIPPAIGTDWADESEVE